MTDAQCRGIERGNGAGYEVDDAEADLSYAFWEHSIVVVLMKINVRKRVVSIKSLTVL